jgi:hypothetical protein
MTVVRDEAVIAFLLFCLEIYQADKNVNESCTEKTRTLPSGPFG